MSQFYLLSVDSLQIEMQFNLQKKSLKIHYL